jgi:hypothetical protein
MQNILNSSTVNVSAPVARNFNVNRSIHFALILILIDEVVVDQEITDAEILPVPPADYRADSVPTLESINQINTQMKKVTNLIQTETASKVFR